MIRSVAAISAAVVLSAVAITPANARLAPLPQGQCAWLTPANVKPYAGFYADLQGTTLTVAYLSTQALSGKSCSADTHLEARSAALDIW